MYKAALISLTDGQSFSDVKIITPEEYEKHGVPNILEDFTFAFIHRNKLIITNIYNVKIVIHKRYPVNVPGCIPFKRITLTGAVSYGPGKIVHECDLERYGIPLIFTKRNGVQGQLTLVTQQGVLLVSDYSVSIIALQDDCR
jgi:hypothetical protein